MSKSQKNRGIVDQLNIAELIAVVGLAVNTFSLFLWRNTTTYVDMQEWRTTFEPLKKSSYSVILQYNPGFVYAYLAWAIVLMGSAMYRLYKYFKKSR